MLWSGNAVLKRASRDDLVKRVTELCREERRRLERQAREEEAEEAAARAAAAGEGRDSIVVPRGPLTAPNEDGTGGHSPSPVPAPAVPTGPTGSVERDGLCVVCQENDAQVCMPCRLQQADTDAI